MSHSVTIAGAGAGTRKIAGWLIEKGNPNELTLGLDKAILYIRILSYDHGSQLVKSGLGSVHCGVSLLNPEHSVTLSTFQVLKS